MLQAKPVDRRVGEPVTLDKARARKSGALLAIVLLQDDGEDEDIVKARRYFELACAQEIVAWWDAWSLMWRVVGARL